MGIVSLALKFYLVAPGVLAGIYCSCSIQIQIVPILMFLCIMPLFDGPAISVLLLQVQ